MTRSTSDIVADLRLASAALPEGYYAHKAVIEAAELIERLEARCLEAEAIAIDLADQLAECEART